MCRILAAHTVCLMFGPRTPEGLPLTSSVILDKSPKVTELVTQFPHLQKGDNPEDPSFKVAI